MNGPPIHNSIEQTHECYSIGDLPRKEGAHIIDFEGYDLNISKFYVHIESLQKQLNKLQKP